MDHGLRRLEEDYVARGGEPGSEDWAARLVVSDGHVVVGKGLLAVGDGILLPDGRAVRVVAVKPNGPREDFVTTEVVRTEAEDAAVRDAIAVQDAASRRASRPRLFGGSGER
jgi:hypothetical protein